MSGCEETERDASDTKLNLVHCSLGKDSLRSCIRWRNAKHFRPSQDSICITVRRTQNYQPNKLGK
jgi:hypothetical protein